jgi:sugar phosphate isomerase/epimerase
VLSGGDLVLCSGCLRRGVPFRERVDAASRAGFAGLSLWGRDYWQARREGLSDADIAALLAGHGLQVGELDPAWWWLPGAQQVSIPEHADTEEVFRYGEDELFRIAEVVGARSLNAVDVFGGDWGVDDAAAAFAGLCDRAAEHGLLVHIEFLPWSRIPDVATAWDIASRAGRPNGGVAVDAWHWFRAGADEEALRRVPGDRILGIQLDDGPAEPEANLIEATLHARLLPGHGEFGVARLLGILAETGAQAPYGVEVFSDDLHALPAGEAARQVAEATRAVVAEAAGRLTRQPGGPAPQAGA